MNSTITDNAINSASTATAGGNIAVGAPVPPAIDALIIRGSLLQGGTANAAGTASCFGPVLSEGHNVIDGNGPCGMSTAHRDKVGETVTLGALTGSPVPVREPVIGSVTENTGPASGCLDVEDNPLTQDQRGESRPAECDSGAVQIAPGNPSTAPAAVTVTVSGTADEADDGACDPGDCTLREAINNAPSGSVITLPAGTYSLTEGELFLDRMAALTVNGAGAATTFVEQADGETARVFSVGPFASLRLNRLTVRKGTAPNGGGIFNDGSLHLRSALVTGNTAVGSQAGPAQTAAGGGVYNRGQAFIHTSVLESNDAAPTGTANTAAGGGLYGVGPTSLQRSLIKDNARRARRAAAPRAAASTWSSAAAC